MLIWEDVDPNSARNNWDQLLLRSEDYSVYQSFAWGEHKRMGGWTPWRLLAHDEHGDKSAMAQILVKSLPGGVRFGWSPGGPVIHFQRNHDLSSVLESLLTSVKGRIKRGSVRFDNYLPRTDDRVSIFAKYLKRCIIKVNSPFSVILDLEQPIDRLFQNASKHHQRDLARALRADIEWKFGNCPQRVTDLATLSDEMATGKTQKFPTLDRASIAGLCDAFQQRAVILTGFIDGAPVSSCLTLRFGNKAVYLAAAANQTGRRVYASYAMVYRLLNYLRNEDIAQFDFGGVNPAARTAAGVNYFKTGFGGRLGERIGEWEWASSAVVRWTFNLSLAYRNLS